MTLADRIREEERGLVRRFLHFVNDYDKPLSIVDAMCLAERMDVPDAEDIKTNHSLRR